MREASSPTVRSAIDAAQKAAEVLVLPSLVAIYSDHETKGGTALPRQTGTGFLVSWSEQAALITASHTLFGYDNAEDPGRKSVFVDGGLRYLDDLRWSTIGSVSGYDLAAIYLAAFPVARCLPQQSVQPVGDPKLVTLVGYLARDFNRSRSESRLVNRPSVYTNKVRSVADDIISFHYPRKKNLDTASAERVVAPIPHGLSGGPLLDTRRLMKGEAQVVGVFFAWDAGIGLGVSSTRLPTLLADLSDELSDT